MKSFKNQISELCLKKFENLPKTGKPCSAKKEWTILSAIVEQNDSKLKVVSMGTGTKCIGSDQLSGKGDILNDSHSEVLARRGFLRYLYEQIRNINAKEVSIFKLNLETKKFELDEKISYHFFTTHSPCGDASIFNNKIDENEPEAKKIKLDEVMTGAKILDAKGHDLMLQDEGLIRTKPGKGVRTLSLSCSDKMSRWNFVGVQGALLFSLISKPIYLKSIVICFGTDCSAEAMKRTIWKRWEENLKDNLQAPFTFNKPEILICDNDLEFKYAKTKKCKDRINNPAPCGTVWSDVKIRQLEVEVSGRRQGVTKKKLNTPASRLKISKVELFTLYIDILALYSDVAGNLFNGKAINLNNLLYKDAKNLSKDYNHQWRLLKENCFRMWTQKPENLLDFSLN